MVQYRYFTYNESEIKVIIDENGIPWFDAGQICRILGLQGDAGQHLRRLQDDEKKLFDRRDFSFKSESENLFPDPDLESGSGNLRSGAVKKWFVNEFGLYMLIMKSEKPGAVQFQRWVTHDVLPAIRQQGSYSLQESHHATATLHDVREMVQGVHRMVDSAIKTMGEIGNNAIQAMQEIAHNSAKAVQQITHDSVQAMEQIVARAIKSDLPEASRQIMRDTVRTTMAELYSEDPVYLWQPKKWTHLKNSMRWRLCHQSNLPSHSKIS